MFLEGRNESIIKYETIRFSYPGGGKRDHDPERVQTILDQQEANLIVFNLCFAIKSGKVYLKFITADLEGITHLTRRFNG
jgi:hypothetical protein